VDVWLGRDNVELSQDGVGLGLGVELG